MPNASPRNALPAPDPLESERSVLRAKDRRRGAVTIAIVESIRVHGYLTTALGIGRGQARAFVAVVDTETFARRLAPEHHHRMAALLALVATACEDGDERFTGHFDPAQRRELHAHFARRVDVETREWARRQLAQPATEQLGLL
jgi:hypothetical protein